MDDNEAIRQSQAGNKEAFGQLVRSYHRPLYYYVIGKVPIDAEAEDIVQRTFVSAYGRLADFRPGTSYLAWLRGIALNHCRNAWRQHQRQAELMGRLLEVKRAELQLGGLDEPAQDSARVAALRACMEELSQSEQRAIQMRFVEQQPLEAIGEQLNRSSEAARQFLFRIRGRLGTCIKRRMALQEATR